MMPEIVSNGVHRPVNLYYPYRSSLPQNTDSAPQDFQLCTFHVDFHQPRGREIDCQAVQCHDTALTVIAGFYGGRYTRMPIYAPETCATLHFARGQAQSLDAASAVRL
jgi:hypothetical protein